MSSPSKFGPIRNEAPTLVPEDELEIEIEDSEEDSEDFDQVESILGARTPERQTVHVVTLLQPRSKVDTLNLSVQRGEATPDEGLAPVLLEDSQDEASSSDTSASEGILGELDGLRIVEAAPGQWSGSYAPPPTSEVATFEETSSEISSAPASFPEDSPASEAFASSLEELDRMLEEEELEEDSLELGLGSSWLFDEISVDLTTSPPGRHQPRELQEVFDDICGELLYEAPHPAEIVDFFSLPDDAFVPGGTLQPPEVSPGFHTGIARAARRTVVRARAGRFERDGLAA